MARYLWSQKLTGFHAAHSATTFLSEMPGMSMRRVCGVELRAFVRRAVPCRGMASGRHPGHAGATAHKPLQSAGAAPARGRQLLGYWHVPPYRAECALGRLKLRRNGSCRPGGCSRQARLPRESQEWLLRPGSKRSWIIHHTPVQCQEVNEAAIAPFRAIRPGPGGSQGAGGAGSRPSSGCSQPPGGSSHIVDGPGHIQPKLYGQIMSKQALIHATRAVCAPPGWNKSIRTRPVLRSGITPASVLRVECLREY